MSVTLVDPTSTHQRFLLAAALRTTGPILELGAGWYSTPLLQEVARTQERQMWTCDTDAEWLRRFGPPSEKRRLVMDWDESSYLPWPPDRRWGLVFVDAAPSTVRGMLVRRLREMTDVFVLHDTEAPSAYGYDGLLDGPGAFKFQITDKTHWTWTTVASNTIDVTRWGLDSTPTEEAPKTVAQYLMRVFPGPNHWFMEAGAHKGGTVGPDGACTGSATLELEQAGWRGLCVEPSSYRRDLLLSGRRCRIDTRLLCGADGVELAFRRVLGNDRPEASGILSLFSQEHAKMVEALSHEDHVLFGTSLTTVLAQNGAPPRPEFISLDTNGSELEILRGHDFDRFRFQVIFVAYGGNDGRRQELTDLLEQRGYQRSRGRGWDDGHNLTFVDWGVNG